LREGVAVRAGFGEGWAGFELGEEGFELGLVEEDYCGEGVYALGVDF